MKTVLYYSYTGNTAKRAKEFAEKNGAELVEVKTAQKISKLKAYTTGCYKALKGRAMPIQPPTANLSDYDIVDVFAPVWAGCIAPPMTGALQQLAKGTKVSLHLVSVSGSSNKEKNTANLIALGLDVSSYEDLK